MQPLRVRKQDVFTFQHFSFNEQLKFLLIAVYAFTHM